MVMMLQATKTVVIDTVNILICSLLYVDGVLFRLLLSYLSGLVTGWTCPGWINSRFCVPWWPSVFLSRWVLSFPASLPALHPDRAEYLPRYRLTTWARRWLSMRSRDAVPVGISGGTMEFSRGDRGLSSSVFALIRAARSLYFRLFLFALRLGGGWAVRRARGRWGCWVVAV